MAKVNNEKYSVTGMSCAACSAHVEKAVRGLAGITDVQVNLLTNSMIVSYDDPCSPAAISKAVSDAGYGASPMKQAKGGSASNAAARADAERAAREALEDHETPVIKKRLIWSAVLLIPLMYISMGHTMWGWPAPGFLAHNPLAIALYELLMAAAVMIINQKFFVNGFKGAIHGGANMDTLVAMGSAAGFVYSTAVFFRMCTAANAGDMMQAHELFHSGMYFESSAMILTLISVGKMLEARSKGRTTNAIKGLMDMAPKEAHLIRDGAEVTVPAEEVEEGDIFVVRPGESFPVDGRVLEGESAVNEAALTGESLPVDKAPGSLVSAATINQNGSLTCEATRVGGDTTLQQIIEMVQNAAASKAPIAKIADKVSGIFVPTVVGIAIVDFIIWMIARGDLGFALGRAISVLVISCPCALGLATPVAIMVGSGLGAKKGILFKTASSLEATGKLRYVVLDKTGTITEGKPRLTDMVPAEGITEEQLLKAAASLEAKSEHPLATAIREYAEAQSLEFDAAKDFRALPGHGVAGNVQLNGRSVTAIGGNATLMEEQGLLRDGAGLSAEAAGEGLRARGNALAEDGKTPLYFAADGKLLGIIAVADIIKEDSKEAIQELIGMGVQPVMLTGDNARTAKAIGRQLGLEAIVSDVLPDGKEAVIRKIQESGSTAMVGDGINDAPALTRADIGVAIGAGADVAIDAADVVLMKSSLRDVAGAIRLSRQVIRNIHENLFWAFFYNAIGIPIAAGALIPRFGITLNPMFGAAAMSLSSFFVVSNALRLNFFDIFSKKRDSKYQLAPLPDFLKAGAVSAEEAAELMRTEPCPVPAEATAEAGAAGGSQPDEAAGSAAVMSGTASAEKKTINLGGAEPSEDNKTKEGAEILKVVLNVNGMMCQNCVKHVKHALENMEGVAAAEVSLENNSAVVDITSWIPESAFKAAIEDAGYEFVSAAPAESAAPKKLISVNGMMCQNCVKHVKKALEGIEGVESAEVSLENNNAVITLNGDVSDETIKAAIEDAGYEFVSANVC